MMRPELTVFYSWQTDTPNSTNRGFIQGALESAAKELSNETECSTIIDRDTKGLGGSPNITQTILAKIDRCDVLVADVSLTCVSETGKRSPNPNVLVELGYAMKALAGPDGVDWSRIVLVMNTDYGDPKLLPFDLRGNRVTDYHLDAIETSKGSVQRVLSKELKESLAMVVPRSRIDSEAINAAVHRLESEWKTQEQNPGHKKFLIAMVYPVSPLPVGARIPDPVLSKFLESPPMIREGGVSISCGVPHPSRLGLQAGDGYQAVLRLSRTGDLIFRREVSLDDDDGVLLKFRQSSYAFRDSDFESQVFLNPYAPVDCLRSLVFLGMLISSYLETPTSWIAKVALLNADGVAGLPFVPGFKSGEELYHEWKTAGARNRGIYSGDYHLYEDTGVMTDEEEVQKQTANACHRFWQSFHWDRNPVLNEDGQVLILKSVL